MLKRVFDTVMERRSDQLIEQLRGWLPAKGALLDLGSGTGHLAARLERDLALEIVTADVSDMHVMGPAPVVIADGVLPFERDRFAGALLVFMLHYPRDPVALLEQVGRVTRGPVILVQTLHSTPFGYAWLRVREFFWTTVAFHISRLIGYVPPDARFSMNARRFYTGSQLERDVTAAGLRVGSHRERPVLPGRALVVAAWMLERDA